MHEPRQGLFPLRASGWPSSQFVDVFQFPSHLFVRGVELKCFAARYLSVLKPLKINQTGALSMQRPSNIQRGCPRTRRHGLNVALQCFLITAQLLQHVSLLAPQLRMVRFQCESTVNAIECVVETLLFYGNESELAPCSGI